MRLRSSHMMILGLIVAGGMLLSHFVVDLFAAEEKKSAATAARPAAQKPVDFTTEIQPLLAKHCTRCHGAKENQSGLRVDTPELLARGGDRGAGVVPGKVDKSHIYLALLGKGDIDRMPAESPPLAASEIALFKRWIEEGAKFPATKSAHQAAEEAKKHWAFRRVVRAHVPAVKNTVWVRNPIDQFVLARLEKEGIAPSPEADRTTLIRRVSLDLRGLTPSPNEIDLFLNDRRPGAYERMVDRMLASPHYGERWGRHWLDAARYADSNGFTIDGPRSIWKYRDWVIDAINADLPFNRFGTEQLAGDLLPKPTTSQLVATGFHRNTLVNEEGGTDQEQFRNEAIVDRASTTGTVFLGLTVACAQCHQHKYDPISQREFYEMFAFFNTCDEPTLRVPSEDQTAELKRLDALILATEKPLQEHDQQFKSRMPIWEKEFAAKAQGSGRWTSAPPTIIKTEKGAVLDSRPDHSLYLDFSIPPNDAFVLTFDSPVSTVSAVRLEALTHRDLPKMGPGRADDGNFVLSEFEVFILPAAGAKLTPVKFDRATTDHAEEGFPVSAALDGNEKTGWAIGGVKSGTLNHNREAIFFPKQPLVLKKGERLVVRMQHSHFERNYLLGCFRISFSDAPASQLEIPASLRALIAKPAKQRTDAEKQQLLDAYQATDTKRKPIADRLAALKVQRDRFAKAIPTTLVLREQKKPRESYIHLRGDFLRHGVTVTPGTLAVLPPLAPRGTKPDRLDLANWLFDENNPLTARVTVNRHWQQFFGIGLVDTENDFGTQGSLPTHPQLLDWLASEFVRVGWSGKSLHRLILTSATYRQSSAIRPELQARDQDNRLLARQSRIRLEAETIRDACLSASGLISPQMHGPGVYPPQPAGLYVITQVKKAWPESQGADRYRRGLYTYFWRSSPYPFLPTFDAPDGITACTRRPRSNTPLQALTLANDRTFVEITRGLAVRILTEAPAYDEGRLRHAFLVCLGRPANETESKALSDFVVRQRELYKSSPKDAKAAGPKTLPKDINEVEGAVWTAVARVLLNLDEFITRE